MRSNILDTHRRQVKPDGLSCQPYFISSEEDINPTTQAKADDGFSLIEQGSLNDNTTNRRQILGEWTAEPGCGGNDDTTTCRNHTTSSLPPPWRGGNDDTTTATTTTTTITCRDHHVITTSPSPRHRASPHCDAAGTTTPPHAATTPCHHCQHSLAATTLSLHSPCMVKLGHRRRSASLVPR